MTVPQDIAAEVALLGSMIVSGGDIIPDVREILGVDDFFRPAHREIAKTLFESRGPVDMVILRSALESQGALPRIGGLDYLIDILESTPSWHNWREYALSVREASVRRGLLTVSGEMGRRIAAEPAADILADVTQQIYELAARSADDDAEMDLSDAALAAMSRAEAAQAGKVVAVNTGFAALDARLCGLHPGDLVIVGAPPSGGKTAFACHVAAGVAAKGGGVLYVSGEMPPADLGKRFLQAHTEVWGIQLKSGHLKVGDWTRLNAGLDDMKKWKLYIVGRSLTSGEIMLRARKCQRRWGRLDLVVVDYLQLMKPSGGDNRAQEVGRLSWELKLAAMQLRVPVVALSQYDRTAMKGGTTTGKRPLPTMHHLKESGDLENNANVVILLYAPERDEVEVGDREVWARIAKSRDGDTNSWTGQDAIRLRFRRGITKFFDTLTQGDGDDDDD